MPEAKPHIDELFKAMSRFRAATSGAKLGDLKQFAAARSAFQDALKTLGVYDAFDWSEE